MVYAGGGLPRRFMITLHLPRLGLRLLAFMLDGLSAVSQCHCMIPEIAMPVFTLARNTNHIICDDIGIMLFLRCGAFILTTEQRYQAHCAHPRRCFILQRRCAKKLWDL